MARARMVASAALWTWLLPCMSMAACPEQDRPPTPPDLRRLTPQLRDRIDLGADQAGPETAGHKRTDFSGKPVEWAISQAVLTPEQELQEAAKVDNAVRGKVRIIKTPRAAQDLFDKLIATLPAHQRPGEFKWTLTTIEDKDVNAFTVGGGFVYVLQPLLDALLAEPPPRGTSAMAFVLAHEIGHVVLGHCRRGYQLERIEAEFAKDVKREVGSERLGTILQTGINAAGHLVKFTYSRDQEYEADLFALHLCRNAGMDRDHVLDGLRWLVMLEHPKALSDTNYAPAAGTEKGLWTYFLSSHPPTLHRLRRLRMELAGTLTGETSFGLFAGDPNLAKARDGQIAKGQRALILLHGLGGNEKTFLRFRELLPSKEFPAERVLEFRYPNNGSLAHAAAFLKREMGRAVRSPERAVFVAHSAGGLVFRAYAEKLEGRFDRAVFLGTPHLGSDLIAAKFLVDLAKFVDRLPLGIPEGVDQTIREGDGQIGQDLHPDSLFLRWLGDRPQNGARYHSHAGLHLGTRGRVSLEAGFPAARALARSFLDKNIQRPAWVKEAMLARGDALRLTKEITHGDWIVSVESATAVGAGAKTWEKRHHVSLKDDEEIVKWLLDLLK